MGIFDREVDPLEGITPMSRKGGRRGVQIRAAGYNTSRTNSNTMKGWHTRANSANADMSYKLDTAIADSRDLAMNTPIANAILGRVCTSVLGPGLVPQSTPNYTELGITKKEAQEWARNAETRFDIWAQSPRCDHTGMRNFYDLQLVAFKSALVSGDLFVAFPWKKKKKAGRWNWKMGVKLIEADLIRTPTDMTQTNGRDIVNGVEFVDGMVAAYWVADRHTGTNMPEETSATAYTTTFKRMPVYSTSGRKNIHHLLLPGGRPSQRRSMPFLTPVVEMLKTVARHTDAELQAAVVSSMFTVFVRDSSGTGMGLNEDFFPEEADQGGGGTTVDEDGEQHQVAKEQGFGLDLGMGPANIIELDENKDISVADARKANDMFSAFHKAMVVELCASLDLPYEQVIMLFDSSYTASKAALQEGLKTYKRFRLWFVRNMVSVAWESFIEEEVINGRIKADGFLDDEIKRKSWARAYWVGPANGQIDPFKEAKASVTKIQNHLSNYSTEMTADTGERWDSAMSQLADERELLEDLGIAPVPVEVDPEEVTGPTGVDPIKPGGQSWSAEGKEIDVE